MTYDPGLDTRLVAMEANSGLIPTFSTRLFAASAAKTVQNSTTETSTIPTGIGSLSIAANSLTVGKAIRFIGGGVFSTAVVPGNLVVRVKMGSVVLASSTITNLLSLAAGNAFDFEVLVQCRSTGASGTVAMAGGLSFANAAGTRGFADLANAGNLITIDTTAAQAMDVTAQWSVASASNIIKTMVALIEGIG